MTVITSNALTFERQIQIQSAELASLLLGIDSIPMQHSFYSSLCSIFFKGGDGSSAKGLVVFESKQRERS